MIHSYTSINMFHDICPRQMYERMIAKSIPFVETPEMKAGKEAHKALENRLLHDTPLPADLQQCEKICTAIDARGIPMIEVKMGVNRSLEETGFWDGDAYIRGVLDLALYNADNTAVFIGDWKTGKKRESPLQLKIFAGFAFAYYPTLQTVMATNLYTRTGEMGEVHTWKRSELPGIWRDIVPLVQEIEVAIAENKFPERQGPLCGWCPVKACKHYRGA